ncbi:MAG TPA: flavin reductase family protein, partial [Allosphingosinicella sp.]|nr:flavin reductase family protein [Allosphingosinicella sp.]
RAAAVHAKMEEITHFGVNVLHRDQEEIARMFADRTRHGQRFVAGWENDCVRPPRLLDAQAAILCRRIDHHQFGTHSIFIGVVEDVSAREDIHPLVYWNGRYGSTGE